MESFKQKRIQNNRAWEMDNFQYPMVDWSMYAWVKAKTSACVWVERKQIKTHPENISLWLVAAPQNCQRQFFLGYL